jgi:hypothetical protein
VQRVSRVRGRRAVIVNFAMSVLLLLACRGLKVYAASGFGFLNIETVTKTRSVLMKARVKSFGLMPFSGVLI